jgi:hypothetical protein
VPRKTFTRKIVESVIVVAAGLGLVALGTLAPSPTRTHRSRPRRCPPGTDRAYDSAGTASRTSSRVKPSTCSTASR